MVIPLLFLQGENRLEGILEWVNSKARLAFLCSQMTYSLGSTVSRRAQDFFNDDDLYLQVGRHLFRGTQPKTGFVRASFTTSTTTICCWPKWKIQRLRERSRLFRPWRPRKRSVADPAMVGALHLGAEDDALIPRTIILPGGRPSS